MGTDKTDAGFESENRHRCRFFVGLMSDFCRFGDHNYGFYPNFSKKTSPNEKSDKNRRNPFSLFRALKNRQNQTSIFVCKILNLPAFEIWRSKAGMLSDVANRSNLARCLAHFLKNYSLMKIPKKSVSFLPDSALTNAPRIGICMSIGSGCFGTGAIFILLAGELASPSQIPGGDCGPVKIYVKDFSFDNYKRKEKNWTAFG